MANQTLNTFELEGVEIDPNAWSLEFLQHMVEQAARVKIQRCTASMKDESDAKKKEERLKTAEEIKAGKLPASGGPGASLTPEQKALRDCLSAKSKRLKGETLGAHLERVTRELAKAQGRDFDEEMTGKVRAHLEASDLFKAKVKEYRKPKAKASVDLGDLEL